MASVVAIAAIAVVTTDDLVAVVSTAETVEMAEMAAVIAAIAVDAVMAVSVRVAEIQTYVPPMQQTTLPTRKTNAAPNKWNWGHETEIEVGAS